MYITDNKTIKKHDYLSFMQEYQFTVFDCKLYIDLLFFTSTNCTINSILL